MPESIFERLFVFYLFQVGGGRFVRSYNWHDYGLSITDREKLLHSPEYYGNSLLGRLLTMKTLGFRCVVYPVCVQSGAGGKEE